MTEDQSRRAALAAALAAVGAVRAASAQPASAPATTEHEHDMSRFHLAPARGPEDVAYLLYPGCTALPLPEAGPVLVLQGDDAGAGCSGLPARAGLTLRLLVGAGHAWDAPGAIWPSPGPVLPDPADPSARLRARADLNATLVAAEALADWFEKALLARQESAIR